MDTLQATDIARRAIETITGQAAETLTRCENLGTSWAVDAVIVETKAKIQDNDILATYRINIDAHGSVMSYERVNRYTRASLLNFVEG